MKLVWKLHRPHSIPAQRDPDEVYTGGKHNQMRTLQTDKTLNGENGGHFADEIEFLV